MSKTGHHIIKKIHINKTLFNNFGGISNDLYNSSTKYCLLQQNSKTSVSTSSILQCKLVKTGENGEKQLTI
jgi:hypothetical protein